MILDLAFKNLRNKSFLSRKTKVSWEKAAGMVMLAPEAYLPGQLVLLAVATRHFEYSRIKAYHRMEALVRYTLILSCPISTRGPVL